LKYYVIAGEASGDLHGANLLKAISEKDENSDFRCWGGDRMRSQGATLVKHYRDLAFMGFLEVLLNLRTILGNLKMCKEDILDYGPDVLVLIDYPGFNMRIARWAKENNIKVIYYISPQIWAWKQNRVHALKRDVDRMICILPFEKDFYAGFDMEVDYVGHPLLDEIENRQGFDEMTRRQDLGLDHKKRILSLLPGSRKQEIRTMLPIMLKAAREFPNYQVALAMAPSQDESFYRGICDLHDVTLISSRTYDLLDISDMAMVTSGTATLETALFKVPQVVCYKGNWLSYWIARRLVKVKYISLVNLIMDKELVKELIQGRFNVRSLKRELTKLRENREEIDLEYDRLRKLLGGGGASARAADLILEDLGL
jgi:lipid-A-disaccharide synthase